LRQTAGVLRSFTATCFMRSWTDFDKITIVSMPLFLFSATFYPLSELPRWLQLVVEALPLYPGVDLCRQLSLGHPSVGAVGDVVAADIGPAEFSKIKNTVRAAHGIYLPDMEKNPLFIAYVMAQAWSEGKTSKTLERLCEQIMRFASGAAATKVKAATVAEPALTV